MQGTKPGIAKNDSEEIGLPIPGGFARQKQLDAERRYNWWPLYSQQTFHQKRIVCPLPLVQVGVNNPAVHATSTLPW